MIVKIKIKETLEKIVEVEAATASEGLVKVAQNYALGKITVDENNLKGFEITEEQR